MLNFIYAIPAWLFLFLACSTATVLACAGQILVHRRFPSVDFAKHNAVGGYMLAVVGTLYAVTLAFVTVIVWQEFDASKERVSQEAGDAASIWHLTAGLPDPLGAKLRSQMADYAHAMIAIEWPEMRFGLESGRGEAILTDAISEVAKFRPSDIGASNTQAVVLGRLADLHDQRRHRYQDNASGVSPFQWTVIIVGALVLFGFCYLFGLENVRVHLLMTAALAITISSMFVLIVELDYPFRGDLSVSPEPWATFAPRTVHL